jgi:ribonuclease HII
MSIQIRFKQDSKIEMGVDEAGRGCLWGPMFAGAVVWTPEEEWTEEHREIVPQIRDSKKLSAKKRTYLAGAIESLAISSGVGIVTADEIDSMGMSASNRLAFTRAIQANSIPPDRILLDGTLALLDSTREELDAEEQVTIVDGDALYLPIAAASILAKHSRDEWVKTYVADHPDLETKYHLLSSKGYGTKNHRDGIVQHGMDSHHRRLFLRKLLGTKCEIQDEEE